MNKRMDLLERRLDALEKEIIETRILVENRPTAGRRPIRVVECKKWLADLLTSPTTVKGVMREAEKVGYGDDLVRRAARELGVKRKNLVWRLELNVPRYVFTWITEHVDRPMRADHVIRDAKREGISEREVKDAVKHLKMDRGLLFYPWGVK